MGFGVALSGAPAVGLRAGRRGEAWLSPEPLTCDLQWREKMGMDVELLRSVQAPRQAACERLNILVATWKE